jgi:hypothetical protein
LCILTSLKTSPLQVVQGRLCGMDQRKAKHWIHVLLVVWQATLRALGDAPSRSLPERAQRLGVTAAEAAALVVPTAESAPPAPLPAAAPSPAVASPLLAMTGRNGASSAPTTRLRRPAVRVARNKALPSKRCC